VELNQDGLVSTYADVHLWDKTKPIKPRFKDSYVPVTMFFLEEEGRILPDGCRFVADPLWIYEPEPRDGTFYPIKSEVKQLLGGIACVREAGLRMYSSWMRLRNESS